MNWLIKATPGEKLVLAICVAACGLFGFWGLLFTVYIGFYFAATC